MEVVFCHHSPHSLWASLDCISGLGKKSHDGIGCTGTSVPVEVHAKSGSRGINLVRHGLVENLTLILGLQLRRNIFLTGAPFTVAVIQIPLRLQTVYGISPLGAGIRLLPFAVLSPIGSGVSAAIAGKAKIPPIYLMPVGAIIQIIGFALLSTGSTGTSPDKAQYGYQAIAGFGVGMNLSILILMTPFAAENRDKCS